MPKIVVRGFVERTPFTLIPYLQGRVYGHPDRKAGEYVQVRFVEWDENVKAWRSRSGRLYVVR